MPGISVKTVETHRSHVMERLDIRSIAGLVRYAIGTGLATPQTPLASHSSTSRNSGCLSTFPIRGQEFPDCARSDKLRSFARIPS